MNFSESVNEYESVNEFGFGIEFCARIYLTRFLHKSQEKKRRFKCDICHGMHPTL